MLFSNKLNKKITQKTTQNVPLLVGALFLFFISIKAQIIDSNLYKIAPSFSGQITVLKGDSVMLSYTKGWANYPLQIRMDKSKLVEIGELSSFLTREVINELADQKFLHLDSSASFYIKGFPYKGIKIKHLIENSSGLPSNYIKLYHRNIYDDQNIKVKDKQKITNEQVISIFKKFNPALEFEPGTQIKPCNTNDIVLAYLVELIYFKTYDVVVNSMLRRKYPTLNIIAHSDSSDVEILNRAYGHKKTNVTELSIQESLRTMGFRYEDETNGHHHIYANSESLAKYLKLNANLFKDKSLGQSYHGHEPGSNALAYRFGDWVIVILSNTDDEIDSQLLLEELKKKYMIK